MKSIAYIDDSRDGRTEKHLVLAALIATEEQWRALIVEWNELLDMRPRMERFHFTEFTGAGDERMHRLLAFYRCVGRHVQHSAAAGIPMDAYRGACAEFAYPFSLFEPYAMAFASLARLIARQVGKDAEVDLVLHRQEEEAQLRGAIEAWRRKGSLSPHLDVAIRFADDKSELPLQAADLCAGLYRKQWEEQGNLEWPTFVGVPSMPHLTIRSVQMFSHGVWSTEQVRDYVQTLAASTTSARSKIAELQEARRRGRFR